VVEVAEEAGVGVGAEEVAEVDLVSYQEELLQLNSSRALSKVVGAKVDIVSRSPTMLASRLCTIENMRSNCSISKSLHCNETHSKSFPTRH
jgi:hypothetical protein